MSLRTKILVYGVGIATVALAVLGTLLVQAHRDTYVEEAELRARTFLAVLAVETTGYLASNQIEVLDGVLSTLMERNLELLDIQFVAVITPDGHVVGHTEQWRYGAQANDAFSVEAGEARESLVRVTVRDGKDTLMVSEPVVTSVPGHQGIRWGTAIAGIGLERMQSNLFDLIFKAMATIGLVIAITAILAALFLSRQVVRPVKSLTTAARDFAAGDLSTRARVTSRDELADLSLTFNDMAEHIQANTVRLEDEVRERNRELESANERLKELATTDGLTGLYNFRHFEDIIQMEIMRSQRIPVPLSLLMIDVDHFKQYNDRHGHPEGDKVLRILAALIRERVRTTDVPCRYGGEEFTVILPGTSRTDASILAEILRKRVEEHPFDGEEEQPTGSLTISIGVATFPDQAVDETDLIREADKAMYEAKKAGRNRVKTARSRRPPPT